MNFYIVKVVNLFLCNRRDKMDTLTYNAEDVARMLNRSKSTAYRRIYE